MNIKNDFQNMNLLQKIQLGSSIVPFWSTVFIILYTIFLSTKWKKNKNKLTVIIFSSMILVMIIYGVLFSIHKVLFFAVVGISMIIPNYLLIKLQMSSI